MALETVPSAPASVAPDEVVTAASPTTFPVGISLGNDLWGAEPGVIAARLNDVAAAGANWIRIDASWASVQPVSADDFDWEPLDAIVDAASDRGLHVDAIIDYTPPWARGPGCDSFICPPTDTAAFAAFAASVAQRYQSRGLTTFEIWNEPNLPLFWAAPDPVAYRNLLIPTVAAVHAAVPGSTILFGGMAANGPGDGAIAAGDFLRTACETGMCADVDGVAYHPYTFPFSPEQTSVPPNAWARMTQDGADGARSLTGVMSDVGLGGKPLWLTEVGAPTGGTLASDGSSASLVAGVDHVTEDWQAHIVSQDVTLAAADPGVFGGVFVYTLDDTDDTTTGGSFGLRRVDGSAKPAYAAFRSAAISSRR